MTILMTVGTSTEAHLLRRQVGIGSKSDCLLGDLGLLKSFKCQI